METTVQRKTLNDLAPGQSGTILSVGNQSGAVKRRLVDMGLTPGTQVKVNKIAPLGDPLEVSLRGYELSLRRADAEQIVIGQPRLRRAGGTTLQTGPDPEAARRQLRDHEHELEAHGGVLGEVEYAADVTVHALLPEERAEAFSARLTELAAGGVAAQVCGESFQAVPRTQV